ncbi:MAG: putative photosynthetic complex assembly protein PuhE [Pseudomonadota bacterium]
MADILQPIVFAALLWWFGTGAILWLVGLPRRTFKWTALGATVLLAGATVALMTLREETGLAAAYAGFAAGVALWAWHEVMFLFGYISGPRKSPCPPGLAAWPRFVVSTKTVIHHELVIAIHAGLILIMSWGAANQIAAWTFFLLWGMRISAKLVVFFGAPNIADGFLPAHLGYLKTYFQKRSLSTFAPIALTLVTSAAAAIIYQAASAPLGDFASAGLIMIGALAALAVLEHWALVLPLSAFQTDAALWKWAMRQPKPVMPKSATPNPVTTKTASSEWRQR